jgi:hypothetical protein
MVMDIGSEYLWTNIPSMLLSAVTLVANDQLTVNSIYHSSQETSKWPKATNYSSDFL